MNIVGTPYKLVHRSSCTARSVAAGSKKPAPDRRRDGGRPEFFHYHASGRGHRMQIDVLCGARPAAHFQVAVVGCGIA